MLTNLDSAQIQVSRAQNAWQAANKAKQAALQEYIKLGALALTLSKENSANNALQPLIKSLLVKQPVNSGQIMDNLKVFNSTLQ